MSDYLRFLHGDEGLQSNPVNSSVTGRGWRVGKGKTLFHGLSLDGLVHLACLREFLKFLDVLGQNEILYVNFG